jgi:predicted ATPase
MYASPPALGQTHVGLTGEYTAAMLDEYRNKEIDYPIPPKDFDGKYRTAHGTLIEALLVWLKRMDLLDAIDTEETSKVGYRLSVQGKGVSETQDLTSVGVGVSQVLPTLVLFLLAPNNSILLIEQPELHLHPKVQSILGDFFLGMAECGKQCIVETHSEYIVNRLRRRIVETPGKRILDKIKIYFVEKEKAESRFREVQPNEYGSIHDWPKGFFDEVDREASRILDAQMNKRRQAR